MAPGLAGPEVWLGEGGIRNLMNSRVYMTQQSLCTAVCTKISCVMTIISQDVQRNNSKPPPWYDQMVLLALHVSLLHTSCSFLDCWQMRRIISPYYKGFDPWYLQCYNELMSLMPACAKGLISSCYLLNGNSNTAWFSPVNHPTRLHSACGCA